MQRDMLPPPDPHPQLQALQSIQPSHPFPIHRPAFAPQQAPRSADTQTEAEHGPDRECVAGVPIDPSPDSVDTRPLD